MNKSDMTDEQLRELPELTKKEEEQKNKLRPKFNIVKESTNHTVVASRRVEISRKWAKNMLSAAFILNCISILCFLISIYFVLSKPLPKFYASTPNGKIELLRNVSSPAELR